MNKGILRSKEVTFIFFLTWSAAFSSSWKLFEVQAVWTKTDNRSPYWRKPNTTWRSQWVGKKLFKQLHEYVHNIKDIHFVFVLDHELCIRCSKIKYSRLSEWYWAWKIHFLRDGSIGSFSDMLLVKGLYSRGVAGKEKVHIQIFVLLLLRHFFPFFLQNFI